jgi:LmbE family N-acetylglucosaminyl deacetylase
MNVLVVTAHPDDAELLCGGTLAKMAARGDSISICHCCNGDLGHFKIPREELARIRAAEAREGAAVIGGQAISLPISDLDLYPDRETRAMVADVIRQTRPDVIFTHPPNDYMPDHLAVSELVFAASFCATLPQLQGQSPFHPKVTPIYYMDTLAGMDFLPEEYVDVTDYFETKVQMLSCHQSQLTWMRDHDGIDFVEFMQAHTRFRGLQAGVKYAEGFRRCATWPRQPTTRLLP